MLPMPQSQLPDAPINTWSVDAIREKRGRLRMAALYATYGDESADEKAERVFAVGGIFGTQDEWDDLEGKWREKTKGIPFHAVDCECDQGDYAKTSHEENQKLYRDLTQLLCGTKLIGTSMVVDVQAHRRQFPGADPYYLCFSYVFVGCAELGYLSLPQGEVKFTFDNNVEKQPNATQLYGYMANQPEWKFHRYMESEVGFAVRRDKIGIQAADLFARESMKQLDNYIGPVKRPIRKSMKALADTNRFFVIIADDRRLGALSRNAQRLGEAIQGKKWESYQAWLVRSKRIDSTMARVHYLVVAKNPTR
ncbi:MAG: hypothetical protein ABSE93_28140 [Terriglobia bacterium]|jgi:hypothetical protein